MDDKILSLESKIESLEKSLQDARDIAVYYQWLAIKSGTRSIREIDSLIQLNEVQKETERKLQYRIDLDTLINRISSHFLEATGDSVDMKIIWSLGLIGMFYKIDRCLVIRFSHDGSRAEITHQWCADDICPRVDLKSFFNDEEIHSIIGMCYHRNPVIIPNTNDIIDETRRRFFDKQEIVSFLSVPIFQHEKLISRLCFDSIRMSREWNDDDIMMVKTIADIISNAMERSYIEDKSRRLTEQLAIRHRIDSLGTMTGGIVHDLNNLLVSIGGNIELSLKTSTAADSQSRDYCTRALQTCRRANNLIKAIRMFINGSSFDKTGIDIHPIISEALQAAGQVIENDVEMTIGFGPGRYKVMANADLLHQVFLNLAVNAITAIKERTVPITGRITVAAKNKNGSRIADSELYTGEIIHIMFEDNGAGMSDDVRRHAFDPLFTTHGAQGAGRGMGLAMVYHIVKEIIGGTIEIESYPGQGTVFHIELPEAAIIESEFENVVDPSVGGTETVMIVDDDDTVRELTIDSLTMYGYKTIAVNNGEKAVDYLRNHSGDTDLVLLDIGLPGMSGDETMKKIRAIRPDMPLVLTSGMRRIMTAENADVTPFLMKPFTIAALLDSIRSTLDSNK